VFFAVVLCSVVQTDGDADSADDYDCGGDYDGCEVSRVRVMLLMSVAYNFFFVYY